MIEQSKKNSSIGKGKKKKTRTSEDKPDISPQNK